VIDWYGIVIRSLCYIYLLNSFVPSQVLQTGLEINEVDNSGFSTQGPTVYAGNLGYNKYIIQVSHKKNTYSINCRQKALTALIIY
jgi:hypothetical protein